MIVLKRRTILAVSHLHTSESKMCIVSLVVCYKHFKPDYFTLHLDFKGEKGILQISWLKRGKFGISTLAFIHAAVVASDMRKSSSQSAPPTVFGKKYKLFTA